MPEPYVREFTMDTPRGRVTIASVVLDRGDFNKLVDEFPSLGLGVTTEHAERFKAVGQVPMIQRGTKTEVLFKRFNVKCNAMGIIVRGTGRKILETFGGDLPNPEDN